jgi:hypothetical protein
MVAIDEGGETEPRTWDESAPMLRPVIRAIGFGVDPNLGRLAVLSRPFQPLLDERVVLDVGHAMRYVTPELVRDWGVTEDLVFDTARRNLAAVADVGEPEDPPDGPVMLRLVDTGDDYWVSRLLLPGWLAGLAPHVGGRPVAFIPEHDHLLVVTDGPDRIAPVFGFIEQTYDEAEKPLSTQGFTVDADGRVVPYAAPDGHPLHESVRRAELIVAKREYDAQKELLDDDYEDVAFTVSMVVIGNEDGLVRSVATWGHELESLLPKADFVAFVSHHLPTFQVDWATAVRETGLTPEPDLRPQRYRVHAWPEEPVLERLQQLATDIH